MRITNTIRESFVLAVLADTPEIDYDGQIREAAQKWLVKNVPADVQKIAAKHPDYFNSDEWIGIGDYTSIKFPVLPVGNRYNRDTPRDKLGKELGDALKDLIDKQRKQDKTRKELAEKLRLTASAYSTTKRLKEALPELAKYLPEDEAKAARTLPAVANTMADLVAAGWPKTEPKKKAKP